MTSSRHPRPPHRCRHLLNTPHRHHGAHDSLLHPRTFAKPQGTLSARADVEDAISAPRLLSRAAEFLREMAYRHTRDVLRSGADSPTASRPIHLRTECSSPGYRTAMAQDRLDKEHVVQRPCCGPAAALSQQLNCLSPWCVSVLRRWGQVRWARYG